MLTRILEPEVMDSAEDAREYDAMDHAAVNAQFVDRSADMLLAIATPQACESSTWAPAPPKSRSSSAAARRHVHVTAVDAAESMLALARKNVAAAGFDRPHRAGSCRRQAACRSTTAFRRRHQQQHRPPHPEPRAVIAEADPRHRARRPAVPPRPGSPARRSAARAPRRHLRRRRHALPTQTLRRLAPRRAHARRNARTRRRISASRPKRSK